jgi:TolB-like protein
MAPAIGVIEFKRMADEGSGWSGRGDGVETQRVGVHRASSIRVLDGRYRIEEQVGAGGMGEVYRARDLELGETVALKLLVGSPSFDQVDLLRREVRLARRVTHENVVRVHDLGATGELYLTMQYVDGSNLRERLALGAPSIDEAIRLCAQICAGLDAAHRAGVIHSDLKPGNVLLASGSRVLITDFGVARALGEQPDGRVLGTPQYMAPEQWSGEQVGVWTDVYALALLVFEVFTGERLLEHAAPMPDRCDDRVGAALPEPLAGAVSESLDPDPARRPPSVAAIARALAVLSGATLEPEREPRGARIAVVPFRSGDGDHLGAGLAEELIRVLAANRGLEVVSGFDGEPRATGRAVDAGAVVHGSVRRVGDRVRVQVELLEVDSGSRLWGERFDGTLADVFAFQEAMALRICEALRVGWLALRKVRAAPEEAIDLYFRARRQLRHHVLIGEDGCIGLLDRCLALAPRFELALAMRAIACAKAWFVPSAVRFHDWEAAARAAAAEAMASAPGLAESHIARAIVAAQDGEYRDCVRGLERALELAPTSADAHNYLGRVQSEAGRADDALWHLELATSLDPSLQDAALYIARHHALRGDRSASEILWTREGYVRAPALSMLMRIACWFRDQEGVRRCMEEAATVSALGSDAAVLVLFGRYVLGALSADEVERVFAERIPHGSLSRRIRSNLHQIMVEGHAARGAYPLALQHLAAAAGTALIDLEWLTRCPILDPLRDSDAFRAAADQVRARAAAVWHA